MAKGSLHKQENGDVWVEAIAADGSKQFIPLQTFLDAGKITASQFNTINNRADEGLTLEQILIGSPSQSALTSNRRTSSEFQGFPGGQPPPEEEPPPTSGKPPWWDEMARLSGGGKGWEDLGWNIKKVTDSNGNESSQRVFDRGDWNDEVADGEKAARRLKLIPPEGSFFKPADAPPIEGFKVTQNTDGTFGYEPLDPSETRTFSSADAAYKEAFDSFGFSRGQVKIGFNSDSSKGKLGYTWEKSDEMVGTQYGSFEEARRNLPPGFRVTPINMNDGSQSWGYERSPVKEINSWDDLVLETFKRTGNRALTLQVDAFRDQIDAKRVTPLEAMNFALGIAESPEDFKTISELAMNLGGGGASSDFLSALGAGAEAFGPGATIDDIFGSIEATGAATGVEDPFAALFPEFGNTQASDAVGVSSTADFPFAKSTEQDLGLGGDVNNGPSQAPGVPSNDFAAGLAASARASEFEGDPRYQEIYDRFYEEELAKLGVTQGVQKAREGFSDFADLQRKKREAEFMADDEDISYEEAFARVQAAEDAKKKTPDETVKSSQEGGGSTRTVYESGRAVTTSRGEGMESGRALSPAEQRALGRTDNPYATKAAAAAKQPERLPGLAGDPEKLADFRKRFENQPQAIGAGIGFGDYGEVRAAIPGDPFASGGVQLNDVAGNIQASNRRQEGARRRRRGQRSATNVGSRGGAF